MRPFKKIHQSNQGENTPNEIFKTERGELNLAIQRGKTFLEAPFKETISIIGYRNIQSNDKGKHGTFYSVKKPTHYETKEVQLTFKNPLIITDQDVFNFEGLSLEYLFWKWFPNLEHTYISIAKNQGIETGELIDKLVTREAIKRGYDGIIMADLEIVDLTIHV